MENYKAFECKIPSWDTPDYQFVQAVICKTRSAAKYQTWKSLYGEDMIDTKYFEFQKFIKVKTIGDIKPSNYFGNINDFERMKEHRNIPFAYQGMVIDVAGHKGWITGNIGFNLGVMFEGSSNPLSNCHPTWETTYYDENMNIIKDYKIPKTEKVVISSLYGEVRKPFIYNDYSEEEKNNLPF